MQFFQIRFCCTVPFYLSSLFENNRFFFAHVFENIKEFLVKTLFCENAKTRNLGNATKMSKKNFAVFLHLDKLPKTGIRYVD